MATNKKFGSEDDVLAKFVAKLAELFTAFKAMNSKVGDVTKRVDAIEKDLAIRPTFSPAALKSASEKLDKLSLSDPGPTE